MRQNGKTLEFMSNVRDFRGLSRELGIVVCLVTAVTAGTGCQSLKKMTGVLGDLRAVQSEVVKATGHDEVTVNLSNGHYLAVGLVNSPSASAWWSAWRSLPRPACSTSAAVPAGWPSV
jgi:hypothetical protein